MQHTYLRYECADAFSSVNSSSTTSTPTTNTLAFLPTNPTNNKASPTLLSIASSQIIGFNLRTNEPNIKFGHRELLSAGGLGTGKALNSNEVLCLVVGNDNDNGASVSGSSSSSKVATGWKDGSVRVFDVQTQDLEEMTTTTTTGGGLGLGLVHSLLLDNPSKSDEFLLREPLLLNGHSNSPITALSFNDTTGGGGGQSGGDGGVCCNRLASGSSDGTIILWDIIAETGLFRLLGHTAPISDLSFISCSSSSTASTTSSTTTASVLDGLISSSQDGLVKVWDLDAQCCTQTVANHGGPITCSTSIHLTKYGNRKKNTNNNNNDDSNGRWRLVTGCSDGRVRVYTVDRSKRMLESSTTTTTTTTTTQQQQQQDDNSTTMTTTPNPSAKDQDDVCYYMGELPLLPPNIMHSTTTTTSSNNNDKISAIHFHPNGKYLGVSRTNSKMIDVFVVRSEEETLKKRTRRLRRRREKESKQQQQQQQQAKNNNTTTKDDEMGGGTKHQGGRKRGILDDDDEEKEEKTKDTTTPPTELLDPSDIKASDEFEYATTIRASQKVKAFQFAPYLEKKSGGIRVIIGLSTNALEVHSIQKKNSSNNDENTNEEDEQQEKDGTTTTTLMKYTTSLVSSLDMYGHPTGIRSIALSSDDVLACTVSKSVTKVWNVSNRSCIRSLSLTTANTTTSDIKSSTFYGLCSAFLPGNTHVIVGTREGYLVIIDIASGDIVFTEKAHEGAVWSLDLKKSNASSSSAGGGEEEMVSIVTGSADNSVKFWDIEEQQEEDSDAPGHPMAVHARSIQTTDDVIAVRYSHSTDPSRRMVFVSTLDCQIKVFFDDTLKFFLSLYGHSLPALAMDASDDDAILASGGADKSIKIWGLDFGDTHRTLYGHDDSITDLRFVKRTHNFFTTSKDGTVRYWDGDRFEQILLLNGHTAEINSLAIAKTGAYVLSAGMDRQVRVWERTQDMVFLEEEKERQMEAAFENLDNTADERGTAQVMRRRRDDEDIEEEGEDGDQPQSEAAVRKSVLSISAGDRIMEAIERADDEMKEAAVFRQSQKGKGNKASKRTPSLLLLGMEPPQYILWVLRTVKSAELEQSLLVIPIGHMERLIYYLIVLLRGCQGVEICARCAIFLVKTHQNQIVANRRMAVPLRELRRLLKMRLNEARDTIGYNLAAVKLTSTLAKEHKARYYVPGSDNEKTDIWAGLGLGSEVAAEMQKRK